MTCIDPPALNEVVLLAHLDGEADEAVESHLAVCDYCMARADELAQFAGSMVKRLYRYDCPDPLQLAEFEAGMLEVGRRRATETHLRACPHCTAELDSLRQFQSKTAADIEVTALDRIRVVVGRLLQGPDPLSADLQPALAGTRGGTSGPLIFDVDGGRVSIERHADESSLVSSVYGLISNMTFTDMTVEATLDDDIAASAEVDELGNFVLEGLVAGEYDLILRTPEREVLLPLIEVA